MAKKALGKEKEMIGLKFNKLIFIVVICFIEKNNIRFRLKYFLFFYFSKFIYFFFLYEEWKNWTLKF